MNKSFEMLTYDDDVLMPDVGNLIDKRNEFLVGFVTS